MIRFAALAVVLMLSGCATAPLEPQVITKTVPVPVAVKCVVTPPIVPPAYVDTPQALTAAPNVFERAKLIKEGKLQREAYIGELEAGLKGCAG